MKKAGKVFNSIKVAFAMFSRLPAGNVSWEEENMKYSMCFIPLVGAVIGGIAILWYWLSVKLGFNELFYATCAASLPILITGGIHMDGFCDVVDAISSYQEKDRKLEILKDPHTGAFAIIYAIVYMVIYTGAFAQLSNYRQIFMVSVGFVLSRSLSCLIAITVKNAKREGTLYNFTSTQHKNVVAVVLTSFAVICAVCLCGSNFFTGLLVILACGLFMVYFVKMIYKNFGGITGDMAGFFIQVCELIIIITVILGEGIWSCI